MIDFYGPQWEDASWIVSGKSQFQHNTHRRHYLQRAGYFHSNALWKACLECCWWFWELGKGVEDCGGASHPRYIRTTQLLEYDLSRLFPLDSARLFMQQLWPRPEILAPLSHPFPAEISMPEKERVKTCGVRDWGRKAGPGVNSSHVCLQCFDYFYNHYKD